MFNKRVVSFWFIAGNEGFSFWCITYSGRFISVFVLTANFNE